ncbi:MAG: hypothetical protein IH986_14645, partial [Planctomycetes bacterium]|nr:hypothetical protein [Planctomycetota bacterium]
MNLTANRVRGVLAALLIGGAFAGGAARAAIIYETEDPFGGIFGINGFDVFQNQSVGVRFTPDADYSLQTIGAWFMNNDASGVHHERVTMTLRDDNSGGGISIPGNTIFETWVFNVSATGWNPELEVLDSFVQPVLREGINYWIVAESDAPPFVDPVWNIASEGIGFMAFTDSRTGEWQPGGFSGVVSVIVEGAPAGPAFPPGDMNCDGALNGGDIDPFFLALGDPAAYL